MADDISNSNELNDLDGLNESPLAGSASVPSDSTGSADPNDEIPVPIAMWPSEIDERAQVVEALRGNGPPPRTDTQVDPVTETPANGV